MFSHVPLGQVHFFMRWICASMQWHFCFLSLAFKCASDENWARVTWYQIKDPPLQQNSKVVMRVRGYYIYILTMIQNCFYVDEWSWAWLQSFRFLLKIAQRRCSMTCQKEEHDGDCERFKQNHLFINLLNLIEETTHLSLLNWVNYHQEHAWWKI